MPPKRSKTPIYIGVAAVAVVVVVLVAFAILPGLGKGGDNESYTPKDGDYLEYTISGYALIITLSGTARMEVTNVTSEGYDVIMTITGIPGASTTSTHHSIDEAIGSEDDYGNKVGSEFISTTWGAKKVDKYYFENETENMTSYVGENPGVYYRIDVAGEGYSMSMVLTATNIDEVMNGNKG